MRKEKMSFSISKTTIIAMMNAYRKACQPYNNTTPPPGQIPVPPPSRSAFVEELIVEALQNRGYLPKVRK